MDDNIVMEANFNGASSELLIQSIFYMLDQAYGNKEAVSTLVKVMPEMIDQYYELSDAVNDVDKQKEILDKLKRKINDGEGNEE